MYPDIGEHFAIPITMHNVGNVLHNAKKYFDTVEQGETLEVFRHGKPIAILTPAGSWRRAGMPDVTPLRIPGFPLLQGGTQRTRGKRRVRAFLDSSALAKKYIAEKGSEKVLAL
jgi:antitoxin (DNA-binding transcriptional repressor) of toxin-antitoxin stability system